jgi:quaternary ammonium compound-resistance protein SugE
LWPTLFFTVTLAGSMYLLSVAVRQLPVGTAYAVWVGIGAAGTAIAAMILHGETMTLPRGIFLTLLIVSIAGLKFTTPAG